MARVIYEKNIHGRRVRVSRGFVPCFAQDISLNTIDVSLGIEHHVRSSASPADPSQTNYFRLPLLSRTLHR